MIEAGRGIHARLFKANRLKGHQTEKIRGMSISGISMLLDDRWRPRYNAICVNVAVGGRQCWLIAAFNFCLTLAIVLVRPPRRWANTPSRRMRHLLQYRGCFLVIVTSIRREPVLWQKLSTAQRQKDKGVIR